MNLLLLTAHAVAEYDDVRMFSDLGYNIFSIGSYTRPHQSVDPIRPTLPDAPYFPDLADAVEGDQMAHKEHLPDAVLEWADVIIVHHYPEQPSHDGRPRGWIAGQWDRIRDKRVVWRTCGQSDTRLEAAMLPYVRDGLQVVRYSPMEREGFTKYGAFAGEDVMIRFGKYPEDYGPWIGDRAWVVNVTQGLMQRGDFTHGDFFLEATDGLPRAAYGEGSEVIGGGGKIEYATMIELLRRARAYLYTGTQPASYTLGLIEAMFSGLPVVSIGPGHMWMPDLFEGHKLAYRASDDPATAKGLLYGLLEDRLYAEHASAAQAAIAFANFDVRKIGPQWVDFLGAP